MSMYSFSIAARRNVSIQIHTVCQIICNHKLFDLCFRCVTSIIYIYNMYNVHDLESVFFSTTLLFRFTSKCSFHNAAVQV